MYNTYLHVKKLTSISTDMIHQGDALLRHRHGRAELIKLILMAQAGVPQLKRGSLRRNL